MQTGTNLYRPMGIARTTMSTVRDNRAVREGGKRIFLNVVGTRLGLAGRSEAVSFT